MVLALPVTAYANIGVPIAPVVGIEIGFYLPGLILIECLAIQFALRLGWRKSLSCSAKWNAVTTLIGFPVVLFMIYCLLLLGSITGLDVPRALGVVGHLYWSFPPAMYPAKQPDSWHVFLTCAMLIWTVVAFALSVAIEERLARRSSALAGVDPKRIHQTILAANVISYVPLWAFTVIQNQIWR